MVRTHHIACYKWSTEELDWFSGGFKEPDMQMFPQCPRVPEMEFWDISRNGAGILFGKCSGMTNLILSIWPVFVWMYIGSYISTQDVLLGS